MGGGTWDIAGTYLGRGVQKAPLAGRGLTYTDQLRHRCEALRLPNTKAENR